MKSKIMLAAVAFMAISLVLPAFGDDTPTREVGLLGGADNGDQVTTQELPDAHNGTMQNQDDPDPGAISDPGPVDNS